MSTHELPPFGGFPDLSPEAGGATMRRVLLGGAIGVGAVALTAEFLADRVQWSGGETKVVPLSRYGELTRPCIVVAGLGNHSGLKVANGMSPALEEHGRQILYVRTTGQYSVQEIGDTVAGFVDENVKPGPDGKKRVDLVGHSMGGFGAAAAAEAISDDVVVTGLFDCSPTDGSDVKKNPLAAKLVAKSRYPGGVVTSAIITAFDYYHNSAGIPRSRRDTAAEFIKALFTKHGCPSFVRMAQLRHVFEDRIANHVAGLDRMRTIDYIAPKDPARDVVVKTDLAARKLLRASGYRAQIHHIEGITHASAQYWPDKYYPVLHEIYGRQVAA